MSNPQLRMRDRAMLDVDRERLRKHFEGFDDMTLEEFTQAVVAAKDDLVEATHAMLRLTEQIENEGS